MTGRAAAVTAFLAAVAVLSALVWALALRSELDLAARSGRADLAVAQDRLVGQLRRYRGMAVLLAAHPEVRAALGSGAGPEAARRATEVILGATDRWGALSTFVTDRTGRVVADSAGAAGGRRGGPHLARALRDGALGRFHSLVADHPERPALRAFSFAAPIYAPGGPPAGAVVVRADVGRFEANWRTSELAVYFTDDLGVIFASNRSELLLRAMDLPEQGPLTGRSAAYDSAALKPFIGTRAWRIAGHEIWLLEEGSPYLPRLALHLQSPIPVIEMTGEALVDIGPALMLAALPALAAAALCLAFGAALFWLSERRRQLTARLALEARTSAQLETRVHERTAALSDANATLRREVSERLAAEAALRKAQADLVQAEKLGALGRMSADIAHELNQPLMAIRSFAENGRAFLDKGQGDRAAGNLDRIGGLAERMDRIIRNLRAFAQQGAASSPQRPVDLGAAVAAALDLAAERIGAEGVEVIWNRPPYPVLVSGGEVRLSQVVSNLVANALDAMAGQPVRRLTLTLTEGETVRLEVADTGTGLDDPGRVFDPFYSTKAPGGAEGLGLGLSISYAIVQSFGGTIRGSNGPPGGLGGGTENGPARGAVFTVSLPRAAMEQVA